MICHREILVVVAEGGKAILVESIAAKLVVGMLFVVAQILLWIGFIAFVFDGRFRKWLPRLVEALENLQWEPVCRFYPILTERFAAGSATIPNGGMRP